MKCVEKIVWPFGLTKFDAVASAGRYRTSTRHITTATTSTTRDCFFGFLDDSGQIYGFAWSSVARTQNVLETATSSLIEYGAAAVNATIVGIVVVIEGSDH